ncbi:MAG: PH domain-containing protein [Planctomycetes bacterium]|nr:PH domain-containing protein [Planctomycetota bacterium]
MGITVEKQVGHHPVFGVVPPSVSEATVMTVWPSVASTGLGQALGRLYRIREGFGPLSIGRLALLATIPVGLGLYLSMRLPWAIRRYRLTNRRVIIEKGVNPKVEQYVDLDRFDAIDVVVGAGQEWYAAGDLVFRRGPIETLRLPGVSRPESFRRTCLETRQAYVTVAAAQGVA